jgi:hypothetical protein
MLLGCAPAGLAQGATDWFRLQQPENRGDFAFGVDPGTGDVVVQGGLQTANGFNDQLSSPWLWHGAWSLLSRDQPSPPRAYGQQFLADAVRSRLLLVGGLHLPPPNSSTATREDSIWQYAGGIWTQLAVGPTAGPLSCYCTAAYDDVRDRIVVFGNPDPASWVPNNETWEWSSATGWSRITPAASPAVRLGGAMTFDRSRARTVLFGGWNGTVAMNDTWETASPGNRSPRRERH